MTGYNLKKLSVLIVEPQSFMQKILCSILRELGITSIAIASTAQEAVGYYKEFTPDLILTDWSPGLNGIQLVKTIRQAPGSPNPYVPIIVISAFTHISHVLTARDAGMTEFLIKPVQAKLLYARIQSVIEKQRVFVSSRKFFGPDRRRRRITFNGHEKRTHKNMSADDRRKQQNVRQGTERRHGFAGYVPPEKRAGGRA